MGNQAPLQGIVASGAAILPNQSVNTVALFDESGAPLDLPQKGEKTPFTPVVTGTAIGTAAKTTTAAEPLVNSLVVIRFTNGNSVASPTVAFNGGAAKTILLGGAAPAVGEVVIAAGGVGLFFYDGTSLHMVGVLS